jgi:hypothetical protein
VSTVKSCFAWFIGTSCCAALDVSDSAAEGGRPKYNHGYTKNTDKMGAYDENLAYVVIVVCYEF